MIKDVAVIDDTQNIFTATTDTVLNINTLVNSVGTTYPSYFYGFTYAGNYDVNKSSGLAVTGDNGLIIDLYYDLEQYTITYQLQSGERFSGLSLETDGTYQVTYDIYGIRSVNADGTFSYTKITTLDLPSTLTTIGSSCFRDCSKLNTLKLSNAHSSLSIGDSSFSNCAFTSFISQTSTGVCI